jgi:predicted RNase H-like HicB family nuclease
MATWSYPATFTRHLDGEIVVEFPTVPGAVTSARTIEEARLLAADAVNEAILTYLAHDLDVPPPTEAGEGEELVHLHPLTATRAEFRLAMKERQLTKVAAASAVGRDEKVVRRILDGRGGVSVDTVRAGLVGLGVTPGPLVYSKGWPQTSRPMQLHPS